VIDGRAQPIGAAMLIEREHLLPLARKLRSGVAALPTVDGNGCVRALTNFYSRHCGGRRGRREGLRGLCRDLVSG